jgi:nucleoside-diphosphate-sugar epimerase
MTMIEIHRSEDTAAQPPSRHELLTTMQQTAAEGLDMLPHDTRAQLQMLTDQLAEVAGDDAVSEYHRYNGVVERELEIDQDAASSYLTGKNILVIGGTGLIGSELMRRLEAYDPAKLTSVSRGLIKPNRPSPNAEYLFADVRDKDRLDATFESAEPDVVFHVAADKYNHAAEYRARHTLTTNIYGTANAVDVSEKHGVERLIYASTGKAARPYSPDIYASSKKAGEWIVSRASARGRMAVAAARFTHVVDDSNVRLKINEAISEGEPVRLQSPDVMFYIQSARESANLLINAGSGAETGPLRINAIRDLEMPVNLTDLGLGAIALRSARVPIYFSGVQKGYEDKAWPALFDPMNAGEVSPLFCSLEAGQAEPSATSDKVDVFPLSIADTPELTSSLHRLAAALDSPEGSADLRAVNQDLSWAMLDGRLQAMPEKDLGRAARRNEKLLRVMEMNQEHLRTSRAIIAAAQARSDS